MERLRRRLERVEETRAEADVARYIREAAAELGLEPATLWTEITAVARCAAQVGLASALREYAPELSEAEITELLAAIRAREDR